MLKILSRQLELYRSIHKYIYQIPNVDKESQYASDKKSYIYNRKERDFHPLQTFNGLAADT